MKAYLLTIIIFVIFSLNTLGEKVYATDPLFEVVSHQLIVSLDTLAPWKGDTHAASIVETSRGTLLTAFKGGECEKCPGHKIWLSRFENGNWTTPQKVADGEETGLGYTTENPVLFQPENGPLMLFYYVGPSVKRDEAHRMIDSTRSNMWGVLKTSSDDGRSWSEPEALGYDDRIAGGKLIGPTKNAPLQLPDESILVATNNEPGLWNGARIFEGRTFHFEKSDDMGQTWSVVQVLDANDTLRPIQPGFLNHGDGKLQVLGRNEGRGPNTPTAFSLDGGQTWSNIYGLKSLPQTHSGISPLTLNDSVHLCILNPAGHWRERLDIMISRDGQSWKHAFTINDEKDSFLAHYPQALQTRDGNLHVVYTYGKEMGGRAQGIRHTVLKVNKEQTLRSGDPGARRPNIVMIISDDQGWGDYGFMDHPAIETPNLDQLATESLVFTRGYVTAPLCSPSLASIITGLYPHQHKITGNDPPYDGRGERWPVKRWSEQRQQLREKAVEHFESLVTLPDHLGKLGYTSLQTGKWWMGNYSNGGFTDGMTHGDTQRGARHGDAGLKIGRQTMQPIYDFIDQSEDQPFFLWYAPLLPHDPFNPPKRLEEKYLQKTNSIHLARYWANCEWFDETCGDLLDYLDKKGLTKNTVVVFVSDNGWIQAPDHRLNAERSKKSPYEGGVRTPIMIKWPGYIKPNTDRSNLASSIDLAPTLLRVCGLRPNRNMFGINLLDDKELKEREAVFGANYTHDFVDFYDPLASLKQAYAVSGEWKLIQHAGKNGAQRKTELFRITNDPEEKKNLAEEYPRQVKYMYQLIQDWIKATSR